jgi:hypothetical protein
VNRLHEKRQVQPSSNKGDKKGVFSCSTHGGRLPVDFDQALHYKEYKKVTLGDFTYATSVRDSCIMYHSRGTIFSIGRIANILDINGDLMFVCNSYRSSKDFFQYPLLSSKLRIFLVSDIRRTFECVKISDVVCKCVSLPQSSDSFVVYPLGFDGGC